MDGRTDNITFKSPLPVVVNGNIVLGSPTSSSITASVILERDGEAFIEYSKINSKKKNKTTVYKSIDGEPISITLNHLASNTSYNFSLNFRLP